MTDAFVDTSVLTDALLKPDDPEGIRARSSFARYRETLLPVYAIREFRAGPFNTVLWLYNKVAQVRDLALVWKAISGFFRRPYWQSTSWQAMTSIYAAHSAQTIAQLSAKYGQNATIQQVQADEFRLALKVRVFDAWDQRRSVTTRVVDSLSCFPEGNLVERRGLLECGATTCPLKASCCLKPKLAARLVDVAALRDVAKAGEGREHTRRYQALREVHRKPKATMSSKDCRALGDAYFSFFAPPGSIILTTNAKDHVPLAAALGKIVQAP